MTNDTWEDHLESITRPQNELIESLTPSRIPTLTITAHPDPRRVGEVTTLLDLMTGRTESIDLSRLEPRFALWSSGVPRPLADPWLSRKAAQFQHSEAEGFSLVRGEWPLDLEVDGEAVDQVHCFEGETLERGTVIVLAQRVALWLQFEESVPRRPSSHGLVGESLRMVRVRQQIERVAPLLDPVLLRGESGTGKELVAQAIHRASPRSDQPFISVNAAAIPPTLVSSELFGAAAGAHSAARREQKGYFQSAAGGTLFLDEIGEISLEVQAALLRVLESGEVQPVGGRPKPIDVRVITATDADLESGLVDQTFRTALFHRLQTCEITLPPLRERRADIGRLFFHFLAEVQEEVEGSEPLAITADRVVRLVLHDWPGNVRELRNYARQLAIFGQDEELPSGPLTPAPTGDEDFSGVRTQAFQPSYRDPKAVGEEELLNAYRDHRYEPKKTARALGISRTAIYKLIEENPKLRIGSQLSRSEIEAALKKTNGDIRQAAELLEVSKRSLRMRMNKLGISRAR